MTQAITYLCLLLLFWCTFLANSVSLTICSLILCEVKIVSTTKATTANAQLLYIKTSVHPQQILISVSIFQNTSINE